MITGVPADGSLDDDTAIPKPRSDDQRLQRRGTATLPSPLGGAIGLLDAVKTAVGIASSLWSLKSDDARGWLGLARRRSALASAGIFGAGVATGASVAALLTPMSGLDARRAVLRHARGLMGHAHLVIEDLLADAMQMGEIVSAPTAGGPEAPADPPPNEVGTAPSPGSEGPA